MGAGAVPQGSPSELALLLAGTAAARERSGERIRALAERVDPAALEAVLRAHGMLALLGERLAQTGAALAADLRERIREHAAAARRQGVFQQMLTVRLLAALEERGVPVLPLKGPLLAERIHGDVGARVSADVDLLVPRDRLAQAVWTMGTFGYEPARGRTPLHERVVHPSSLPAVELHWRIHWHEERFSAGLLARARRGADGWLVPQPADELAALLLLYARDGFAGLRLAADVAAWWDRYADELAPGGVSALAEEHPSIACSLATAAEVAERLVGVPAARVLTPAARARASRRAMRFANWPLRGGPGQIGANVSLVDWLLAPDGQARALARRHLLLGREDLEARWPEGGARARDRARLRALHLVRVLRRYAIAGWVVARAGAWAPPPSFSAASPSPPPSPSRSSRSSPRGPDVG